MCQASLVRADQPFRRVHPSKGIQPSNRIGDRQTGKTTVAVDAILNSITVLLYALISHDLRPSTILGYLGIQHHIAAISLGANTEAQRSVYR